ncbi:MAG: glycosyltransferase family 2 protein [Nitrospirota bacterium]|nr:glycosyltransferase family 2 protein [Nitrospirota bacterium]
MSVAAVVVSFNRLELLRKCLTALQAQDRIPDEIILVDNCSSDGSPEMVREEFPDVSVFEPGENLGGAGGFAWGLELAIAHGHDSAWLMDDDAEPLGDSLGPLVRAMESSARRPGFVSALVVNDKGLPNEGHLPVISTNSSDQLEARELGGLAVESASFVGVLIDLHAAARMPLPYADFFIWFDDAEYTRRLAVGSFGLSVPSSKILHPEKANQIDMGPRLFHYVRNFLWMSRLDQRPRTFFRNPVVDTIGLLKLTLIQGVRAASKRVWADAAMRAFFEGIFRTPRRVMPGDLLRSRTSV